MKNLKFLKFLVGGHGHRGSENRITYTSHLYHDACAEPSGWGIIGQLPINEGHFSTVAFHVEFLNQNLLSLNALPSASEMVLFFTDFQRRKNQPKEEVFGRTSLRTSGQKLQSGPSNAGKTSILPRICCADVHGKTSV